MPLDSYTAHVVHCLHKLSDEIDRMDSTDLDHVRIEAYVNAKCLLESAMDASSGFQEPQQMSKQVQAMKDMKRALVLAAEHGVQERGAFNVFAREKATRAVHKVIKTYDMENELCKAM